MKKIKKFQSWYHFKLQLLKNKGIQDLIRYKFFHIYYCHSNSD